MAIAFSFLYSNIGEGKPTMKIQLSQNGTLATAQDRSYNLMGNSDASETALAEELCNECYSFSPWPLVTSTLTSISYTW